MFKRMTTVSTLPSKMQFLNTRQNEARGQAVAKLVVHPGTRNLDLAAPGRDRNKMIGRRPTISILDPAREVEEVSVMVHEVVAEEGAEEGGEAVAVVAEEEVGETNGLEKINGYLHVVDPDVGGLPYAIMFQNSIRKPGYSATDLPGRYTW
jgi:hypothetical protein